MSFKKSSDKVFFNTKCKYYSKNYINFTVCSHNIFKSKMWEESNTKGDEILQILGEYDNITGWSQTPFTDNDYVRNDFKKVINKPHRYNTSFDNVRDDNLKRAKDKVFDIVYLNDWEWFLTITFDDKIVNAAEIPIVLKKVKNWLDNAVKRKDLHYILIPEYHKKDNRVHAHALVKGALDFVSSGTYTHKKFNKPVKLSTFKKYGIDVSECQEVFNCSNWKYGFSTGIKVYGDKMALSYYITKYLTKDTKKIFGKFYWSSRNLKRNVDTYYLNCSYGDLNEREFVIKNSDKKYKYKIIRGNEVGEMLADILKEMEIDKNDKI